MDNFNTPNARYVPLELVKLIKTRAAIGLKEEFSQFMAFISNRGWRADFSGDGEVISPTGQKVAIPTKRDSEGCWVNDFAEARRRVARVEAAH